MKILLIAVAAAALASQAQAGTVVFDFQSPAGAVNASTHTYTAGVPALSITATGYDSNNNLVGLYDKTSGGGESGLGLVNDTTGDHEIIKGSYVQIDVSSIFHKTPGASFFMGSTTGSDAWTVYGSNTAGSLNGATQIATGADQGSGNAHALTSWGSYKYYDFAETGGTGQNSSANVLLSQIDVATGAGVPEPATWAMMLVGLLGMGAALRSRRGLQLA